MARSAGAPSWSNALIVWMGVDARRRDPRESDSVTFAQSTCLSCRGRAVALNPLNPLEFDSLPPRREENAHRDARLAREMRRLTSMTWDDK